MLRERYAPMNLFDLVPSLSMALDPVLTQLDPLLDDDALFQAVKADLARRCPRTPSDGRPSTPVEVILRMLVVKHLYGWSYEATERWVSDSLVLRQFCRVYAEHVPDDTTLLRWANLIQPATLHRLLDHVVALGAVAQGHARPQAAHRWDGGGDQHPSSDRQHVALRWRARAQPDAGQSQSVVQRRTLPRHAFRERTRSAKRQMKRIMEAARQRGTEAADRMHTAYQHLLDITQATVQQAQQVGAVLQPQATPRGKNWRHLGPRRAVGLPGDRADDPTGHAGGSRASAEKVVSLFEPHTAIIRKGKPGRPQSLAACSGWMRSRAASSVATRSWRATRPRTRNCRRVWTIIGGCLSVPPPARGGSRSPLHRERAVCHHAGRQAGGVAQAGSQIGQTAGA